jgi:hypothetical protein
LPHIFWNFKLDADIILFRIELMPATVVAAGFIPIAKSFVHDPLAPLARRGPG